MKFLMKAPFVKPEKQNDGEEEYACVDEIRYEGVMGTSEEVRCEEE